MLAVPGRPGLRDPRARRTRQTWLLWVALLLLGVGAVGWGGLFSTLVGETAGAAAAGAAAGVTARLDNIGIFIGPPLFGLIVDRTGSYAPAWWAMVVAAALAACALALVREPRRAGAERRSWSVGHTALRSRRPSRSGVSQSGRRP